MEKSQNVATKSAFTPFFCINKENKKKKKKKLIKDKMQIKNVDMRIIKWLQQFHNKSYATSCYPVIGR